MADEKTIKTEELTDEQIGSVAGGKMCMNDVNSGGKAKKCATPGCNGTLPYNAKERYCAKCMKSKPISGSQLM